VDDIDVAYQVIIDPSANDRMYEHFEFFARVSQSAAYNLLDGLLADIHSLGKMPYRNPIYDRPYLPKVKYRYMISGDRYRIVYQIEETLVLVDDIQDCRQSDINNIL